MDSELAFAGGVSGSGSAAFSHEEKPTHPKVIHTLKTHRCPFRPRKALFSALELEDPQIEIEGRPLEYLMRLLPIESTCPALIPIPSPGPFAKPRTPRHDA